MRAECTFPHLAPHTRFGARRRKIVKNQIANKMRECLQVADRVYLYSHVHIALR